MDQLTESRDFRFSSAFSINSFWSLDSISRKSLLILLKRSVFIVSISLKEVKFIMNSLDWKISILREWKISNCYFRFTHRLVRNGNLGVALLRSTNFRTKFNLFSPIFAFSVLFAEHFHVSRSVNSVEKRSYSSLLSYLLFLLPQNDVITWQLFLQSYKSINSELGQKLAIDLPIMAADFSQVTRFQRNM